jgi:hypothetical protein
MPETWMYVRESGHVRLEEICGGQRNTVNGNRCNVERNVSLSRAVLNNARIHKCAGRGWRNADRSRRGESPKEEPMTVLRSVRTGGLNECRTCNEENRFVENQR